MTRRAHAFDDSDDELDLDATADFVPLRLAAAAPPQDAWRPPRELRPELHAATIACEYGHPTQPTTLAWTWWVADRPETRSPAWWRARLPAGVDFRLAFYPDGVDSSAGIQSRRELLTVPSSAEAPEGILVEPAAEVVIKLPISPQPLLATLTQVRREDGRPFYIVSPVSWMKATAKPAEVAPSSRPRRSKP